MKLRVIKLAAILLVVITIVTGDTAPDDDDDDTQIEEETLSFSPKCAPNSSLKRQQPCSDFCDGEGDCDKYPVLACFCNKGFARIRKGEKCIPIAACPKKCPANSSWKLGGPCDDLCGKENMACTKNLVDRCFCDKGFVRLEPDGECRPVTDCLNSQCNKNGTVYNECGNPCLDKCPEPGKVCATLCKPGCYCPRGTVNIRGRCRPAKECPVPPHNNCCPRYMSLGYGNECTDACGREQMNCKGLALKKDCYCDKGLYRVDGECVPFQECTKCSGDAEFKVCGNPCDNLCPNSGVKCDCKCFPGCYCKKGFMLVKGKCVEKKRHCGRYPFPTGQFGVVSESDQSIFDEDDDYYVLELN